MVIPFQPTGVTYFNSLFDSTIYNVIFGSVLAFLVLLELENVTDVFIYRSPNINKRSLDRYILFSRVSSMRGMWQTISGLEYPPKEISTERPTKRRSGLLSGRWLSGGHCNHDDGERGERASSHRESSLWNSLFRPTQSQPAATRSPSFHQSLNGTADRATDPAIPAREPGHDQSTSIEDEEGQDRPAKSQELRRIGVPVRDGVPRPRVRRYRLIAPIIIRVTVLTLELGAIYFSSNITNDVYAGRSFNVRLTERDTPGNISSELCRTLIEDAKGIEQKGSVLLCMGRREERITSFKREGTKMYFLFSPSLNKVEFRVQDEFVVVTSVYVEVFLNLMNDANVQLAPLRPDLDVDDNYSKRILFDIMDRAMNKLGANVTINQIEERVSQYGIITYEYPGFFNEFSRDEIGNALLSEMQKLTLHLNVTQPGEEDVLYVFKPDRGYFRHEKPQIAVVAKTRLAQGWFMIAWTSLLLTRLIAQLFFTTFDEVAYPAVKRIHGADLAIGPMARVEKRESLQISKFSDGTVGHIGYRKANDRQDHVENFYGCEIVLGRAEGVAKGGEESVGG